MSLLSIRTAVRRMQVVRDALDKSPQQTLTIKEFCGFYDLNEEDVRKLIPAGRPLGNKEALKKMRQLDTIGVIETTK